jgi:hypothetical protein
MEASRARLEDIYYAALSESSMVFAAAVCECGVTEHFLHAYPPVSAKPKRIQGSRLAQAHVEVHLDGAAA